MRPFKLFFLLLIFLILFHIFSLSFPSLITLLLPEGIEIKTPDCQFVTPSDLQRSMDDQRRDNNRNSSATAAAAATATTEGFFMPGISGRFREQIEKRKLLWQKKEPEKKPQQKVAQVCSATSSRSTKVWEAVNFAQDQDGEWGN